MMHIRLVIAVGLLLLVSTLYAQKFKKVSSEYVYYAPENVTLENAKRTALERAKIQAIADNFGTIVSQKNTTFINNKNGESKTDFFAFGESEVKGEWIETIGEPQYTISYEQGVLVVKVIVSGRIREIVTSQVDIRTAVLCNGTELKFARSDFKNGDDLYLYFNSPVNGYLTVYLLDETAQMVYCLLPYRNSSELATRIEHDKPYIFFSTKFAEGNVHLIDEYTMTCSQEQEYNVLYIIFSPNEFTKANSNATSGTLPKELTFKDFQKWLIKLKLNDKDLISITERINISN